MKNFSKLWRIFLSFFKIGAFTFGGGYAMIPLIQKEAVETRKWVTDEDILEIIAIAESTPGPVAINAATFVGYRTAGFWGAVFATMGVVLPSFAIILIIAFLLDNFMEYKAVQYAFKGINAGVLALLFKALWNMYKKSPKNWAAYVVMGASFLLTAVLKVNMFLVLVGCAIFGLVTAILAERRLGK